MDITIKKNIITRILIFLPLIFIFASCSTSKSQYYFSRYSLKYNTSSTTDSLTSKVAQAESKEKYSEDLAFNKNEDEVPTKLSDTLSSERKIIWQNPEKPCLTKAAINSDTSDNHVKNYDQKASKDPKSERKKSNKAGILIIIILAVIILGVVIVNNSIGDFGSGSILHF